MAVEVGPGPARPGLAGRGVARLGTAWRSWFGMAGRGMAG